MISGQCSLAHVRVKNKGTTFEGQVSTSMDLLQLGVQIPVVDSFYSEVVSVWLSVQHVQLFWTQLLSAIFCE